MNEAFLDVAPLFENQWTGISVVTEQLTRGALHDAGLQWSFFYDNVPVEREVVADLLMRRSGGAYLGYLERQLWEGKRLQQADTTNATAVFLNVKPPLLGFRREAMVVHDLSSLLTPEFHHEDTVNHHANRIGRDVETTDIFFCVSQATANDLSAYFQVEQPRLAVLPMGIDIDVCDLAALTARRFLDAERYVCVLGTIEPRKNGIILLSYIERNPAFLDKYKLLFVGRDGWLDQKNRLLDKLRKASIDVDRILFPGFVSERQKLSLLYFSKFCVYPSFFEGFGIPVAEAAQLGKFVVCSNTSSLPEVAPERCFFFDPGDLSEFARAMNAAQTASEISLLQRASFSDVLTSVRERSWQRAYDAVGSWVQKG